MTKGAYIYVNTYISSTHLNIMFYVEISIVYWIFIAFVRKRFAFENIDKKKA